MDALHGRWLKRLEKKLDGNYTRMLRAIRNRSLNQNLTKQQTIRIRRTRHTGHCWRSRDEQISDVLLWIPSHGRAKAGRPAWTYIQQLRENTVCSPEDRYDPMNDRKWWRERVRDIRVDCMTRWWWLFLRGVTHHVWVTNFRSLIFLYVNEIWIIE